jgi:hypothetical protein
MEDCRYDQCGIALWTRFQFDGVVALLAATHVYADCSALPSDGSGFPMVLGMSGAVFVTFALVAGFLLPLRSRLAESPCRSPAVGSLRAVFCFSAGRCAAGFDSRLSE